MGYGIQLVGRSLRKPKRIILLFFVVVGVVVIGGVVWSSVDKKIGFSVTPY